MVLNRFFRLQVHALCNRGSDILLPQDQLRPAVIAVYHGDSLTRVLALQECAAREGRRIVV